MPGTALTVRPLRADDADALVDVGCRAFLADVTPALKERELLVFEPGRYHGVFESQT